ncbi:GTP-binding protein [Variovorax sp. SRS16]|uniref:GTP-binding protein n=1 Tax=Variovorax sp. SRS16 TaxID=282217 RepID=UPI0013A53BE0|nr:GTPase [Variovorax sp. SRS16]
MNAPRIVLFGEMGIGKTTAVRALCGDTVVDCDVANLDTERHAKATTTVGADFGIVRLGNGDELHVYGSPGQSRFDFMRRWLLGFAMGVMVLVDLAEADAIDHAQHAIAMTSELAPEAAVVVLVARPADPALIQHFAEELAGRAGWAVPVMQVDVRDRQQMLDALELLVAVLPDPAY